MQGDGDAADASRITGLTLDLMRLAQRETL